MARVKKLLAPLDEIVDPEKRLICGVLKQAVFDYQHPKRNPQNAINASVFLLEDGQTWAQCCGLVVDQSRWEKLIALL